MMKKVSDILYDVRKDGYAIGAFNVINIEMIQAVFSASQETKTPVIVQFTESTMKYVGGKTIFHTIENMAKWYYPDVCFGIHLDHGKSMEIVQECLEIGVPSVMFDGSRREYEENISLTKQVVEMSHKRKVCVQGELGSVPYKSEVSSDIDAWDTYMTNPDQAVDFVKRTGIDTLAVAIGNAHGMMKERFEPDYDRLSKIAQGVSLPLVIHGASDWDVLRVREVVSRGVACFNVDTSSRVAFAQSLSKTFKEAEEIEIDIRKVLGNAREAMKEAVKEKIQMFRGISE